MQFDIITHVHFRRMSADLGGLYGVEQATKKDGAVVWPVGTLGHYSSEKSRQSPPATLMLAMCTALGDWGWLDAINHLAGREYVAGDSE